MAYEWLDLCNKKNLKKRSDYGVRVARPGFDAYNCADNQLIFNSGWPILQICAVIDFSDGYDTYTRYNLPDDSWSDELPSGYTVIGDVPFTGNKIGVNRNYVRLFVESKAYSDGENIIFSYEYKRKKHYLKHTPFFIEEEKLSGVASDKVVLFSIDIENDVDYPYTDKALPFIGTIGDYGMKSSSVFGSKVPGLSTRQFSKMAQAVKTNSSAKYIDDISGAKIPIWSPLNEPMEEMEESPLTPFEAFGFAIVGEGVSGELVYDDKDGGYYSSIPPRSLNDAGGLAYAYGLLGQSEHYYYKSSLVVLRSPLVTPEYEEVEI